MHIVKPVKRVQDTEAKIIGEAGVAPQRFERDDILTESR